MPVPPVIKIFEFDTTKINPSGFRHLTSHTAFVKELGSSAGQYLDFGKGNIGNGKQTSKTAAIIAFFTQNNGLNEALFNMRLWVSTFDDFNQGTFLFNGFPSGRWIQNIKLTDASGHFVPTILPSGQNWWRESGNIFNRNQVGFQELTASGIDGIPNECQVTMPFYLSLTVNTDVPPKFYGGDGGGWQYRLTFDYR